MLIGVPAETTAGETRVAATPETVKKLTEPGFEIVASTPEEFAAFQQAEMARWKRVIEVGKITLD